MNEMFWKHEYLTLKEVEIPKLIAEFLEDLDSLAYRIYKDKDHNIMKVQVLYSKYTEILGKWEARRQSGATDK